MKRYDIDLDSRYGESFLEITEQEDGQWVKWDDLEVVLSVVKDRVKELQVANDQMKKDINESLSLIQSWVNELEYNYRHDVDYLAKAWDNIEDIKVKYKD